MQTYDFSINPKRTYYQRRNASRTIVNIERKPIQSIQKIMNKSTPNNVFSLMSNMNKSKKYVEKSQIEYSPTKSYDGNLDSFVSHNQNETEKKYLGVLTRCKDEFYVQEFVSYYLSQGVDKIYIIDDNSRDKSIYRTLLENPKVCVIFEKDIIRRQITLKIYQRIRKEFEWLIYCDVDEFITTKKNIQLTIKDEIMTNFDKEHIKCVCIPWVMMSCNGQIRNPKFITQSITHRWNHNLKHPHPIPKFSCRYREIEIKSIFRPKYYEFCPGKKAPWGKFHIQNDHIPSSIRQYNNDKWESVNIEPFNSWHFIGLREKHIYNAHLVCFHYRVISQENNANKIKTNIWYKKYKLSDMNKYDYPEIVDFTIRDKMIGLY